MQATPTSIAHPYGIAVLADMRGERVEWHVRALAFSFSFVVAISPAIWG